MATRYVSKPGASGVFLPTRASGTGQAGEYDETTGTFLPRPRPMTDDQLVGKKPANKKTAGIGVG
jgi:hypothetical protein